MAWLSGWTYRKKVTLSRASGVVTNYQMKLLLGESFGVIGHNVSCEGRCASDFDDIRFTSSDGTTVLDYWIESISGTTPNQLATIWIEFNSIGTGDTTFYMYYGNAGAAAYSNGVNTFKYFDDFEWGSDEDNLNTSGGGITWTAVQGTAKLDTAQKYGGLKSARFSAAATYPSYSMPLTNSNEISVMMRVYKETAVTNGPNISQGNGTKRWAIYANVNEDIMYYTGSQVDTGANITPDIWQLLEFNDFDFAAGTFDIWLNGTRIKDAAGMYTNGTNNNILVILNADTTAGLDFWLDNLIVRNYRSTEPIWGNWGGTEAEETSWLTGWAYRKSIDLAAGSAVTNYQVKLLIGESSGATGESVDCEALCKTDFSDLRFTTSDGIGELEYWIESITGVSPNQLATVWVRFNAIAVTDTTFYMYYGNAGASAVSNGDRTFILFDDFEDSSINAAKWTNTGSFTESGGSIWKTANNTNTNHIFISVNSLTGPLAIRAKTKVGADWSNEYGWGNVIAFESAWATGGWMCGHYKDVGNDYYGLLANPAGTSNNTNESVVADQWYIFELRILAGNQKFLVDGVQKGALTTAAYPVNPQKVFLACQRPSAGAAYSTYFDWFFVKNCIAVEPTSVWGDIEILATTVSPTTIAPTIAPTTLAPTTLAPTTLGSTTLAPTTLFGVSPRAILVNGKLVDTSILFGRLVQ